MAPKEPTRHQLSSRLAYQQHTPAFLRRMQSQVTGVNDEEDDDFDEWQASSGRPPIPRRPTPPERPADDPGSADEDDLDEKPQVVVLREGKHLTAEEAERYAENERRKAQGLPPLPNGSNTEESKDSGVSTLKEEPSGRVTKSESASLSFSSAGATSIAKASSKKRKVVNDDLDNLLAKEKSEKKKKKKTSKTKRTKTGTLLSFGDDDG